MDMEACRKELFEQGYSFVGYLPYPGELTVRDIETGQMEEYIRNDGHHGFSIDFDGGEFEFVRSIV